MGLLGGKDATELSEGQHNYNWKFIINHGTHHRFTGITFFERNKDLRFSGFEDAIKVSSQILRSCH